jgi:hypothetical protein
VTGFGEQTDQWLERSFPRANTEKEFQAIRLTSSPGTAVAFMRRRLALLDSLPGKALASPNAANQLRANLSVLGAPALPPTGGVGFGMIYTPQFRSAYQAGTGIAWGIVFSVPPGGSVSGWLYITAMNRASLGAEAFVAYDGQTNVSFNVVDWSDPSQISNPAQWPVRRDISTMQDYLGQIPVNGVNVPFLRVINITYLTGAPNSWANEVHVLNVASGTLEMVYQRPYQATLATQQSGSVGFWGPIVETHEPSYSGTGPMGCAVAKMGINNNGGPFQWSNLVPPQASPRNDGFGFKTLFLNPEFSWSVVS